MYAKRDLRQLRLVLRTSSDRDQRALLLAAVRKKALASLVQMARFKSVGHAYAAFIILARIVGYPDAVAESLLDRGEREVVITAAIAQR